MMLSNSEFLKQSLPHLDNPEMLVPELNCILSDWTQRKDAVKTCLVSCTPYSMMIGNLGLAILYDVANRKSGDSICERFYYPEAKLLKRLHKEGKKFFSLETCHNLKEFDILGFSIYFPQQQLMVPEIFSNSDIDILVKNRGDDSPFTVLGGPIAFAAEGVYNMFDMFFIGEGEEGIVKIIEAVRRNKGQPGWKDIVKKELCNEPGCYVPEFYKQRFYPLDDPVHPNQLKETIPCVPFAPARVKKAVIDLKKHEPLSKILIPNSEGLEMASGAVEIARGCSNKCSFCNGSWISLPYRERDIEVIEKAFQDVMKETGAAVLIPFAFNHSDFSYVNRITKWILDHDRTCGMSSQRTDKFDEEFARIARKSGHRTCTIAIESASERQRAMINKNVTEEDILRTFDIVFRVGFVGVKIYMISNLPYTTQEDALSIISLMKKILKLREEIGAKCRIRVSWTPFQAKDNTPLQWAKTYSIYSEEDVGKKKIIRTSPKGIEYGIVSKEDVGLPILDRSLHEVMDFLQPLGIRSRASAELESALINQVFCFADRRLASVIIDAHQKGIFQYSGGMTVGHNVLLSFRQILLDHGLDYSYFFREKNEDEVFSWDILDTGVDKSYLLKAWHLVKWQAKKTLDGKILEQSGPHPWPAVEGEKQNSIPVCEQKCTRCGICYKEGFQKINKPDRSNDFKIIELPNAKSIRSVGLVKFRMFDDYRWTHNSKKKFHLRRAFVRLGLPVLKDILIMSDNILEQNWVGGVDYAEILLYEVVNFPKDIVEQLNKELFQMQVLSVDVFPWGNSFLRGKTDSAAYYIELPYKELVNLKFIDRNVEFAKAESFIVKYKMQGPSRDSIVLGEHDVKKDFSTIVWERVCGDKAMVGSQISWLVTPYDFWRTFFKTNRRRLMVWPTYRLDYFQKYAASSDNMFDAADSKVCSVCNRPLLRTVEDKFLSQDFCVEHTSIGFACAS